MKTFKEIKKDLKAKDPLFYTEIMNEAEAEIEEIKKQRGGKRQNSGRKSLYKEKVQETFSLEKSDVIYLKEYAKKHNISKNKAIQEAISFLANKEAQG